MTDLRKNHPVMSTKYDNIYILADSKGRYLRNVYQNVVPLTLHINPNNVHFWFRKGQNSADGLRYLESQAGRLGRGRSLVLFWHFTCDLTTLKRPERYLVPQFDSTDGLLQHLRPTFDRLEQLHRTSHFDVGILQCPPVFWQVWNRAHDDPDWKTRDDSILHNQVDAVNQRITEINQRLGYRSPVFPLDFMVFRKRQKQASHKSSYTPVICPDGIHPVDIASEKWLYQILRSASD